MKSDTKEKQREEKGAILNEPDLLGYFKEVERAFYVSSPVWNPDITKPPYQITEDMAFVVKGAPYRPIFFPGFYRSVQKLSSIGAAKILPSQLKEPIDCDSLEDRTADMGHVFLIYDGVLMRVRKDEPGSNHPAVHTVMLLGNHDKLVYLANVLDLPHPFDDSQYPHQDHFINNEEMPLRVLRRIMKP